MKKLLLIFFSISIFLSNCASIKHAYKQVITTILEKDANFWSIEECNKVLKFYSADNKTNHIFSSVPSKRKVLIKTMPLNKNTISALSRKEVIEKRLEDEKFFEILDSYLNEYTSFRYDQNENKIVEADTNYSKGYSFNVYFENVSDPYEPIFLEDGYSYFFLENLSGDYSRVTEVSGMFVEEYLQLDGYLSAVLTFSPFSSTGKRIFFNKNLDESYRLVFNGLQDDPIAIHWNLN